MLILYFKRLSDLSIATISVFSKVSSLSQMLAKNFLPIFIVKKSVLLKASRLSLMVLFLFSLSLAHSQTLQRYEYSEAHMGTLFRIVMYAESEILAQKASTKAFDRIEELNTVFSDYLETSELSLISKHAFQQNVKVSDEMWPLLKLADELHHLSEGSFNIAMGPLTKLWRRAIRRQELPAEKSIKEALDKSDWNDVVLDESDKSIRFKTEGMRLDMGGIAKGHTVDEAYKILLEEGIPISLVDGGGDIFVGDAPPDKEGWTITIESNSNQETQNLVLSNTAVASSGSTFKFIDNDNQRYSHIINPITGYGISDPKTVNVRSNSCVLADAFATTFSVLTDPMAVKKILALYQSTRL